MMNQLHRPRLPINARLRGRLASSALVLAAAVVSGGCNDSPWKSAFRPSGETFTSAAYQGSVKVREVPWERVQGTLGQLYAELVASDVPEADMPESQRAARKAMLLRGLQVTADPKTVEILGRSEFRSTDRVRPDDGKLAEFARSIGANSVVWASMYMGQTDVIRSEPVTEYRSGSYTPRGDGPSRTYSETSTIYVPVYVKADERAWMAYFLRERADTQAAR
ncbi:MAG: hypothetical protein ACK4WH_08550 [Phycisphaerales bacterium]